MTILDEVEILHIFRPTMESFEGQGDSIQSPDNERGDDVQTTGEQPSRSTRRVVCLTHYRVSGLIALAGAIAKINGNMGHTWALDGPH